MVFGGPVLRLRLRSRKGLTSVKKPGRAENRLLQAFVVWFSGEATSGEL